MTVVYKVLAVLAMTALIPVGLLPAVPVLAAEPLNACANREDFRFVVTITNVSDQSDTPTPFAPGVWALSDKPGPLFVPGAHPGILFWDFDPIKTPGLEDLAEDGNPGVTAATLAEHGVKHGVFNRPVGAEGPGPLLPGASYSFIVDASAAPRNLTFALMFVQSNDWFVGTDEVGISLESPMRGAILGGDITDQLYLWDAGTEEDEPVGEGPNQAPRQSGANTGPEDDDNTVRLVDDMDADQLVAVTVTPRQARHFQVSITNVSADRPIAPGVVVPHCACDPLFTEDRPDRGQGLESLAEDGNPSGLAEVLALQALPVQVLNTPVGADAPGPLLPGQTYQTTVFLEPSEPNLSLAFMYVLSNDLFLGSPAGGIMLWDEMGNPVSGDVTSSVYLWDAGTEHNQPPGEGDSQPLMQGAPDTGDADVDNTVRLVNDGYDYPVVADLIRVVVTPQPLE